MNIRAVVAVCVMGGLGTGVAADEPEHSIYEGPVEQRVATLAGIQPGLGVIMHELGYRTATLHGAANGGNWGLAQYELKEMIEALEVAELTRPQRADMLRSFEKSSLVPLGRTIEDKDLAQFNQHFESTVTACNACHTAMGVGFIQYRVPEEASQEFLDVMLETDPGYAEDDE